LSWENQLKDQVKRQLITEHVYPLGKQSLHRSLHHRLRLGLLLGRLLVLHHDHHRDLLLLHHLGRRLDLLRHLLQADLLLTSVLKNKRLHVAMPTDLLLLQT